MDVALHSGTELRDKDTLDRIVRKYLETASAVSGRWLRSAHQASDPGVLVPRFLHRVREQPHDLYTPTPHGLFASSLASRCFDILDSIVGCLGQMFRADPDFHYYTKSDVLGGSARIQAQPIEFVAVILACRLSHEGGHSQDDFRFGVPGDIEHIVSHASGREMMRCAECGKTRWATKTLILTQPLQADQRGPVTIALTAEVPHFDCSFVTDSELAAILTRDCKEIVACLAAEAWKATMVLCGSALECLLTYAMEKSGHASATAKALPLAELVKLSMSNGLLTKIAPALPDALREHRNLVHPRKERGSTYRVDGPEARIAVSILEVAVRDVREALHARESAT